MRFRINLSFIVFSIIVFSGCAGSVKDLQTGFNFNQTKRAHDKNGYMKIYKEYKDDNDTDDLLWNYETGTVGLYVDEYKESIGYFDNAEEIIKKYDKEITGSKIAASIGSTLTNDNFMDYRPRIYEKIMVNTYKGIDFILLKDFANARIEFNRALVRQDRAKEFFKKEIKAKEEEIQKDKKEKLKKAEKKKEQKSKAKSLTPDVDSIVKNKKTQDAIEKKYSNLFAFKPYPDFVNPFTTYMAGLFFLNVGDYRKATTLLKESYGMVKGLDAGDKYVLNDFKLASKMKVSRRARKQHYTWVVFLNGEGPIKKELKINLPLFIFPNAGVFYSGIALPTLKMRNRSFESLTVKNGKAKVMTKKFASMDRVVKTEFKKRFPLVVTRAVTRTVVQTLIQKELNDRVGGWAGLAAAVYQGLMNRADTRIWEKLPKEFQVARVKTSSKLEIYAGSKKVYKLQTDPKKNYIVFVTIPEKIDQPIVQYQKF